MDVGIIAASLVVMRPCFNALYNATVSRAGGPCRRFVRLGSERYGSEGAAERAHALGMMGDGKIVRTVDIQLDSRKVSTEAIAVSRGWGMGGR